jgi:hypothetical protein
VPSTYKRAWPLYLVVLSVASILVLQKTKQAVLPAKQTPVLWSALAVVVIGVIVLVSGWGRESGIGEGRLDTLANDFYPPRREALINGGTVLVGVVGSLWWATATWAVVLGGLRRHVIGRGLLDFEVAAVVGALTGGVIGAVLGLVIGHIWETRHRRRRRAHRPSHA